MDLNELVLNDLYLLLSLAISLPILIFLLERLKSGKQLPPGPFSWPFLGNVFDLDGTKPHVSLANLAETYGPLLTLRFGSRVAVVASTPSAAREIYKIHDRELSGRFELQVIKQIPRAHSSGIVTSRECDERWRFLRGVSHTHLFSSQALEYQSHSRLEKVKSMLDFLCSKDGEVVNISNIVFATHANTFSSIMVSQDVIPNWSEIGGIHGYVRRIMEAGFPGVSDMYPALAGLDFWAKEKVKYHLEMSKIMWGDILRKKRMNQDAGIDLHKQDFMDILINNSFDDYEIYNLITEFFTSSESISIATIWAMTELLQNQDVLAKLRDEVAKAVEGRVLSERVLSKLPYLQACIKETLRLHPPGPLTPPRSALETCEVMGYKIPKNTLLVVNTYALGRDSNTWEHPLSFKPERFLLHKSGDAKRSINEAFSFGSGRRMCVGYPLGIKQIQLILASLVQAFDWSLPLGTDIDSQEYFFTTLPKKNPLMLIMKKRNELQID